MALYEACDGVLRQELNRRKSGWRPQFLGLDGQHWTEENRQELLAIVLERALDKIPVLVTRANQGVATDGYVAQLVRNVLQDRRRAHDPHGSSGFRRLRASIKKQIAAGAVIPTQPDRKLGKGSMLLLTQAKLGLVADETTLRRAIASFPARQKLLRQFTKSGYRETRELEGLWPHLASCGLHSFAVGDMLAALRPSTVEVLGMQLEDTPARRDDPGNLLLEAARRCIDQAPIPEKRRALLHALLRHSQDHLDENGRINWAEAGRSMGLDRRRVNDHVKELRDLLSGSREISPEIPGHGS